MMNQEEQQQQPQESRNNNTAKSITFRNRDKYYFINEILGCIIEGRADSITKISYAIGTHDKIITKYLDMMRECGIVLEYAGYSKRNVEGSTYDRRTKEGSRKYYEATDKGLLLRDLLTRLTNIMPFELYVNSASNRRMYREIG